MEGERDMTKNHGWVLYLSSKDTLFFKSNDAARIWHTDHFEADGSFRVLYKRDAQVDKKRWDKEWDRLRGFALEEKLNVLVEGYVEAGEINWTLVQELNAKSDHLTSWEFESEVWQDLEFANELLEKEDAA
jgi:hypothetical protein